MNQITADRWNGLLSHDEVIISPTVDDLVRVVKAMDAIVRTSVFLEGENCYMAIGGGGGQYVVYVSPADRQFWNLIADETDSDDKISLVVGGQDGDYPARQVVDKSTAIKAAESFFVDGKRDASLHWEFQK